MNVESIKEILSIDFPPLLREIPNPPKRLYRRGELPKWDEFRFLAVVGSRKYSNYGKEVCEELIAGLAHFPVVIISGLALGIDSIAHRSALKAGLKTIAIPGSGLLPEVLYPASHRRLADEIIENEGCLISEFEPNFRATTWSFPQRNRLMAGMSHAVLVIEAEIRSGTLITSKLATEYNRDVLTVPGSIHAAGSEGPHMLLRIGATPITSSKDLLEALHLEDATEAKERNYSDCSPQELNVLKYLKDPLTREELFAILKLPAQEVNALLSLLEIKGHIKESAGEIRLL